MSREQALAPEKQPVLKLVCEEAFDLLSEQEKKYVYYLSKGAWVAVPITMIQTSVESLDIFHLILALFRNPSLKEKSVQNGVTEQEWEQFLQYTAVFLGNAGNYLSFGDSKILPRIPKERLQVIVASSESAEASNLFEKIGEKIYSFEANEAELGIPPKGVSAYYSPDIREQEIQLVARFMESRRISPYNTRLFKLADNKFELRLASVNPGETTDVEFEGVTIEITRGDYREYLAPLVENLRLAKEFAANDHERNMLDSYVKHFLDGDIEDHKQSQRHWIKNLMPVVETNLGFIESYRDPLGVRGEYEAFVSVVDKQESSRLNALVDRAEEFIATLPWPKEFEKTKFNRPDFTSLSVVTFASSGIPLGINIPNYDDIREHDGFKNVSLGNVLSAATATKSPFIDVSEQDLYIKTLPQSFGIQVALHELLGHGSGRLLSVDSEGKRNFDDNLLNPITGEKIATWYKAGETYDSVFQALGSAFEECRAEAVGLYLCLNPEVLPIFGIHPEPGTCHDVTYINYLFYGAAGLKALEVYSPETKKWRQAHSQARFALLRVLLEADGLLSIDDNLVVRVNRDKILTEGARVIGDFLGKLNVFKATADVAAATALFEKYTSVSDDILAWRDIVLARKQPRPVFVQPHLYLEGDRVQLKHYEPTPEGLIQSFLDRFPA